MTTKLREEIEAMKSGQVLTPMRREQLERYHETGTLNRSEVDELWSHIRAIELAAGTLR